MAELIQANWMWLVIALAIGVLAAWWVFVASRRTKVQLEDKPEGASTAKRNQALIDAPPAAVPVAEPAVAPMPAPASAPTPSPAPAATGVSDLTRIKGVGPKLVALLAELGVTSFAQVAAWDDSEIDRIDAQLGRFQGRIRRDDWVGQAKLLAAGDMAAYEARFGRTS